MKVPTRKMLFRLASIAVLTLLGMSTLAPAAQAHDPLFLEEQHHEPSRGPFLPDGRISFALYGTLLAPEQERGFRFEIPSGERISLSLLVPDLAPENLLPLGSLPSLRLIRPDLTEVSLIPSFQQPFAEPFSGTNYLRLTDHVELGTNGIYQVRVTGMEPARFTVSIGYIERFGTPVENLANRNKGMGELAAWYGTPPPSTQETTTSTPAQEATTITPQPDPESAAAGNSQPRSQSLRWAIGGLVILIIIALLPLISRRQDAAD